MRPRTPKPSRALADWSLQGLMSRDEYDRYATRVAELNGTLRGTDVQQMDGSWWIVEEHPGAITDLGPFHSKADALAKSRRMATNLGRGLTIAAARMQAEKEVMGK